VSFALQLDDALHFTPLGERRICVTRTPATELPAAPLTNTHRRRPDSGGRAEGGAEFDPLRCHTLLFAGICDI
jgi:hypothetical protein